MRLEAARHCFPTRWRKIAAFVATALLLCAGGSRSNFAQQPDASGESLLEPKRSRAASDELREPSFFVLPIRTELQRQLLANGKPVHALVALNAFATMGKTGVERMRALDILALRRALAQIKTANADASAVFVIGFLGAAPLDSQRAQSDEHKLLTKECRDLAKEANLRVTQISATYIGTPGVWPKVALAAQAIDRSKETDLEAPATDAEIRAFPVRTKVSEMLTGWCRGGSEKGADCVVYLGQPINASSDPLIGPALEARIAGLIKRLNLPRKDRIDYHLVVRSPNHAAWQRNHDAIMNRFVGKEANALSQRLGFKDNSVTW